MNRIEQITALEQLNRALKFLEAYRDITEGSLEPDDEPELLSCIEYFRQFQNVTVKDLMTK